MPATPGRPESQRIKRLAAGLGASWWAIALLLAMPEGSLGRAAVALGVDERLGPAFVGLLGIVSQLISLWVFQQVSARPADRLSRLALVAAAVSVVLLIVCSAVVVGNVLQGW